MPSTPAPDAFLSITLHAHLPYVLHHGTWPHGLEWLLESAAETYLPLLCMLRRLQQDGIRLRANLSLSPVLLEQLASPVFRQEFPEYVARKISAAQEDEQFFEMSREPHFASLARFWQKFYAGLQQEFERIGGDIIAGFREQEELGAIEVLTSAATHGYAPLLGTDESVRAQFLVAVETHRRFFGRAPAGVWLPECGYRPAGEWSFPVAPAGMDAPAPARRAGLEQILQECGLRFFLADTHTIDQATQDLSGRKKVASMEQAAPMRIYRPWLVAGEQPEPKVAAFPRDPVTAVQVWSAQGGYPGDFNYLDFYKKRWPGGHRLWRVTAANSPMDTKEPYHPEQAAERAREHARHFVGLVGETLSHAGPGAVLSAPFDAELFGHWWFEGIAFLEDVARLLARPDAAVQTITGSEYLESHRPTAALRLPEGSWGAGGGHDVWLNADTAWIYAELYRVELCIRSIADQPGWQGDPLAERLVRQMCRELLLLESSDWQTLITTGGARDYAERRFKGHLAEFNTLLELWTALENSGDLGADAQEQLAAIESRDIVFPHLHPAFWQARADEAANPKK